MDRAELHRTVARASDPNLIAGIYNYCDRCCHRCAFTARCFTYRESRARQEDPHEPGASPLGAVTASLQRAMELMRMFAEQHGITLTTSPEDEAASDRQQEAQERAAHTDPIVITAKRYPDLALPIAEALMPIVRTRDDPHVRHCVERIGELAISIASKTYRAVLGSLEADHDASDLQSDVNGSAKIARLMIAESREAWTDVMKSGQASIDGVPAQIVLRLADLDALLGERFPQAMSFVRPGFDETDGLGEPRE